MEAAGGQGDGCWRGVPRAPSYTRAGAGTGPPQGYRPSSLSEALRLGHVASANVPPLVSVRADPVSTSPPAGKVWVSQRRPTQSSPRLSGFPDGGGLSSGCSRPLCRCLSPALMPPALGRTRWSTRAAQLPPDPVQAPHSRPRGSPLTQVFQGGVQVHAGRLHLPCLQRAPPARSRPAWSPVRGLPWGEAWDIQGQARKFRLVLGPKPTAGLSHSHPTPGHSSCVKNKSNHIRLTPFPLDRFGTQRGGQGHYPPT